MAPPVSVAARRVCVFAQIIRQGLGDLIMRNGFFALIRRAFPGATLTLVIGPHEAATFAEYLELHSPIDDVIVCPPVEAGSIDTSPEWDSTLADVRRRSFDVCVVDVSTVYLHAPFARRAGIPVRVGIGFGHPGESELTASAPLRARSSSGPPDLADYVSAYAVALGLPPIEPSEAVVQLPFIPKGEPPDIPRPRVALHVGGGRTWNRRWPLPRYIEFCNRFVMERSGSFVLVGAQEDEEHAELIGGVEPMIRDRIRVLDDASLARTATVVSGSDVFVGSDSGPMHLAVAVGTPSVTPYGPHSSVLFWQNVYPRHHPVFHGWPCHKIAHDVHAVDRAPCAHRCLYPKLTGGAEYPACLTDISVDEMLGVVYSVLDIA